MVHESSSSSGSETKHVVVHIPEDCTTLEAAVKLVEKDGCLATIVLGKGEHIVDGNWLEISSSLNIVGQPGLIKEEIIVVGGIRIHAKIQNNVHLQHMTIRHSKYIGVWGQSSFTMKNVIVEECGDGIYADGAAVVGRCTNIEVRQCGMSGVAATYGATLTLSGAKTIVHDNCTHGTSGEYGLKVACSPTSTIQFVSPLTKEIVSGNNVGGLNWGAGAGGDVNQIKTIGAADANYQMQKLKMCSFCHCKKPRDQMKKCSKCGTKYCSKNCQQSDWQDHKQICKMMRSGKKKIKA